MKQRTISGMLCAVFLLTAILHMLLDIPITALMPADVAVTYQGEEISAVAVRERDHRIVSASCRGNGNYSYQWQIQVQEDLWADITGQTSQDLELSYALTRSVLDDGRGTYIRCAVTEGEETAYSQPVSVTITYNAMGQSSAVYASPVSYAKPAAAAHPESEYVRIIVNYLDGVSKDQLFSPYTATIECGADFVGQNVISPTFLGYAPYYNESDPGTANPETAESSAMTITLNYTNVTADIVYNIYYKAIDVPYAAKYYFQNIYDDLYTENVGFYKQDYAKTGTIIADAELTDGVNAEGFTKLYHYPESVAADGSTVFECYYDRNYYLLKFDMAGGYGVDPIYARYDTPFAVNMPVRHGYVFAGWDKLDASGAGDGIADAMPARIPAENQSYRALWTTEQTSYTAVYWLQNPDDDGYSYWGSESLPAHSASLVSGEDRADDLNLPDVRYTQFERADTDVVVNGEGSTIVNVYYKRKEYTMKFYYAKERSNGDYWIAGGSTWMFAGYDDTNAAIDKMLDYVTHSTDGNNRWGEVTGVPTLNEKGQNLINTSVYQTGTTVTENGNTYYYISFSARYGESIGDIWPLDVFNSIETSFSHFGQRAYFSAWNVEHHSYYNHNNTNKTLKGNYLRLDSQLLYDQRYEDSTTICFLGFWENGLTIVNWNKPNQLLYRVHLPVFDGESWDSTYNDVNYRLFAEYDTCDNNGDWNDDEQTATAVEGFTYIDRHSYKNGTVKGEDGYERESYIVNFYYTRNNYQLTFQNHGAELTERKEIVPYDKSLSSYYFTPPYPDNLEENAYEFGGWYTSPGCYDGTELNWQSCNMPANDLMLYAKWVPVNHHVSFFKTYAAMLEYENSADPEAALESLQQRGLHLLDREVVHGNFCGSVDNPDPLVENGTTYDFAGWFYMDNGEKKAYTPLDMPVTDDMHIFADWGSHSPQPYTIHYVLDREETSQTRLALLNTASAGSPTENVRYTITDAGTEYGYVWMDGAYHLCVAGSTTGYGYQGSTRTFRPKAGDPYNQLYNDFNKGYFPTLSSHSITMQYEEDKTNAVSNVFTFTYVQTDEISYTVRYVDKNTGQELLPSEKDYTSDAVVTRRFQPIVDYIPDAFYKRLVLAVVEDPNHPGEYIGSDENVIIFYYSKNVKSSFYAVHFMLQKAGADGTDYAIDGSGDYEENDSLIEGIGDTGSTVEITPLTFSGFTLVDNPAYMKIGAQQSQIAASGGQFEITIDQSGTELYIFYTREKFDYKVYYLEYGTSISDLSKLENAGTSEGVLADAKTVHAVDYGASVTETALTIDGFQCVSTLSQSIVIAHDSSKNNIIFFYSPMQYTVEYRVAGNIGGMLTRTSETIYGDGKLNGSQASAYIGYRFDGWYLDEACTISADKNAIISDSLIEPDKGMLVPLPDVNVFYAKFTPQYGSITIRRENAADESVGDQVFVYRITNKNSGEVIEVAISGNDSVTVHDLLYGDYAVEQLNDWSWRYGDVKQDITLNSENASAAFQAQASAEKWLSGNSESVVNRKGDTHE